MESISVEGQRIKKEYEDTLVFPVIKPDPQFVLCPIGLVGAGKTTVMMPLAERLSLYMALSGRRSGR